MRFSLFLFISWFMLIPSLVPNAVAAVGCSLSNSDVAEAFEAVAEEYFAQEVLPPVMADMVDEHDITINDRSIHTEAFLRVSGKLQVNAGFRTKSGELIDLVLMDDNYRYQPVEIDTVVYLDSYGRPDISVAYGADGSCLAMLINPYSDITGDLAMLNRSHNPGLLLASTEDFKSQLIRYPSFEELRAAATAANRDRGQAWPREHKDR